MPRFGRRIIVFAIVAMLATSCGTAEQGDTTTDASVASTSVTMAPTTVAAPSSTASVQEPLVFVALGDSGAFTPPAPDGLIYRYADMLEAHFGVEVDLRNRAVGSLHSETMLEQLRNDEQLRSELAAADVVTTDIPVAVWIDPLKTASGWQGIDPAECGGDDGQQCLRDALNTYRAHTDAIIDELVAICDDEALIRLYDVYMINTGYKLETGTLGISNPYWKAGMDYVHESAARYGIPVAHHYDAFMGPDGTDDPYVKGLLDDDQLHPNAAGASLMAELLDQLGYEPRP